jgi:hypothetical protein
LGTNNTCCVEKLLEIEFEPSPLFSFDWSEYARAVGHALIGNVALAQGDQREATSIMRTSFPITELPSLPASAGRKPACEHPATYGSALTCRPVGARPTCAAWLDPQQYANALVSSAHACTFPRENDANRIAPPILVNRRACGSDLGIVVKQYRPPSSSSTHAWVVPVRNAIHFRPDVPMSIGRDPCGTECLCGTRGTALPSEAPTKLCPQQ